MKSLWQPQKSDPIPPADNAQPGPADQARIEQTLLSNIHENSVSPLKMPQINDGLILCLLAVLFLALSACSPNPTAEVSDQSQFIFSPLEYGETLNVNCILNPDSSTQYLAVERVAGRVDRQYNSGTYFIGSIHVNLADPGQSVEFERRWPRNLNLPNWDIYILPDSTMDIDYGGTYNLTLDIGYLYAPVFSGSTVVPGDFKISSPAESSLIETADEIRLSWTESVGAAGYVIFGKCYVQDLVIERSETTTGTDYTFPLGLTLAIPRSQLREADYRIEVWAVGERLMEYFRTVPLGEPFSNSGISNAYGIFSATVIRRVFFSMQDEGGEG